ncbi:flagellar biosynthetic protein FliO [Rhizobium terrae]|uniref:flagellar biosynthetic protein FliO n=1 Tax=Rhizobium terrae TaxID=2171756 RepID=UPI000E3E096E|nr:flagellar biosynthetic protein FliO [Rhizobium terrae]
MFEDLMGAYGGRLVIAILGVGLGLLLLVGVLWTIRGRGGPSPFVRGGKNRQPRLQVLDAAAVDTRRRLVLVRRDDVEHLIMIGGPTDIVIESGIGLTPAGASANSAQSRFAPLDMSVPALVTPPMEPRPVPPAEPRAVPASRPVPAAPIPELRAEPLRENPPPRERPRPIAGAEPPSIGPAIPTATVPPNAAAPMRPAPPVAAAAPQEAFAAPKVEAPVREPSPARPEPLRPIAALAAAQGLNTAASALDAARGRVFQEAPEPRGIPPLAAPPASAALQSAAERPTQLGNDFEKILEQEMANNLAARETAAPGQPDRRETPPRDPSTPKVTGATPDPSLQSEVARIFGEMSVNREK